MPRIDYDALEDEFEEELPRAKQEAIAVNKLKKTIFKKIVKPEK